MGKTYYSKCDDRHVVGGKVVKCEHGFHFLYDKDGESMGCVRCPKEAEALEAKSGATFASFDPTYQKDGQADALAAAKDFMTNETPMLLFHGGYTQVGKTHLGEAIISRAQAMGVKGLKVTMRVLCKMFMEHRRYNIPVEARQLDYDVRNIRFLLIDELGIIERRDADELQDILDARAQLKTVMTTNLVQADFESQYGERILARLKLRAQLVLMEGKPYGG